jgi:uncharacterized protein
MVPGSGPANRLNDGYFKSIMVGLLEHAIAAASFDKRGVGESSGDWRDTDPAEQAADVAAQLACLRAISDLDSEKIGLFGHSQGGWVVLEVAAADPSIAFVVTNSGPGVTMASQERYATEAHLRSSGASDEAVTAALDKHDALVGLVRDGADFETVAALAGDDGPGPRDAAELELVRRWFDHDPRPALERIACPILAIYGENDLLVPVDESVSVFRAARGGSPLGCEVVILPAADHRLQVGEPMVFHPAYLPTLAGWILEQVARLDSV